ncbi:hypothetical protein TNCV_692371 [Trichonephila clavipes]|nr:hypothetical protein TNCV_692371 [Trichonephila clavipes]
MKLFGIFSAFHPRRDPAVEHLAIHLENGQRVYLTEENVLQRAFEAPKTTLTEFLHCVKNLMFLANSCNNWCMVMFHVISHGTNPVKMGATETRKTTSFQYRHIQS